MASRNKSGTILTLPTGLGPCEDGDCNMSGSTLRLVENGDMDKKKALEAALGQIERAFGKGSIMRLGDNDMVIDTYSSNQP